MRLQRTVLVCAAAFLGVAQGSLHAQQIKCVTPEEPANASDRCTVRVPKGATTQTIQVRVEPADSSVVVTFRQDSGTNGTLIPLAPRVDKNGIATTRWSGTVGDQPVVIRAMGSTGGQREIELKLAPAPGTSRTLLPASRGGVPHWFVQRQLTDSTRVFITSPGSDCSSNVVVFTPSVGDGTVSPDSVRGVMEGNACVATTWWTLGSNIGRQHLRAVLADERSKTLTMTAIGRGLPRLGGGLALIHDYRSFRVLKDSTAGDSTRTTVSKVGSEWRTDPLIVSDFPVVPSARWLRGVLGVALKSPDRDFYVGISALQPFVGVTREGVAYDLQFVMHAGRRKVVRNSSCIADMVFDDCQEKDKFLLPMGFGFVGFVDGSTLTSLLGTLFK